MAIRIAMIPTTTSNSTRVKPLRTAGRIIGLAPGTDSWQRERDVRVAGRRVQLTAARRGDNHVLPAADLADGRRRGADERQGMGPEFLARRAVEGADLV